VSDQPSGNSFWLNSDMFGKKVVFSNDQPERASVRFLQFSSA
jgi:hypothetical protein